jgi:hypothetical protein
MKKIICLLCVSVLFFSFTEDNWTQIFSDKSVSIKSKQADCTLDNAFKQRWFLLQFSNSSSEKVKVEWNLELFDENKNCVTCSDTYGEYQYSLVLAPGETLEGKCDLACAPELRIVSKLLDVKASMSYPDFKLSAVKVSTVK